MTVRHELTFDERRATEAAAFLLSLNAQKMNGQKLIQLLYLADREALIRFGAPITTDQYDSTKQGPMLINVSNLISYGSSAEKIGSWSSLIFNSSGDDVSLVREISEEDYEELSVAECELLDEIWAKCGSLSGPELVDVLRGLKEWHDPHGSSVRISYPDILRAGGRSEDFIAAVMDELNAADSMRLDLDVLGSR
jgi:uncharacterized phage-associated protein